MRNCPSLSILPAAFAAPDIASGSIAPPLRPLLSFAFGEDDAFARRGDEPLRGEPPFALAASLAIFAFAAAAVLSFCCCCLFTKLLLGFFLAAAGAVDGLIVETAAAGGPVKRSCWLCLFFCQVIPYALWVREVKQS